MKKYILTGLIVVLFSCTALAESVSAPKWSEFCPEAYLNAKSSRFNKNSNYWYNRKIQFEESLALCNSYKGDKLKACYSKIRTAEHSKNKSHNSQTK